MRIFALTMTAFAGLAFWRRKTLKDDVVRAKDAGKDATARVSGRMNRGSAEPADSSDAETIDEGVDDGSAVLAGDESAD